MTPRPPRRAVAFCGALNGLVSARRGETPEQALERAEDMIHRALDRAFAPGTLRLNVHLEPDESGPGWELPAGVPL